MKDSVAKQPKACKVVDLDTKRQRRGSTPAKPTTDLDSGATDTDSARDVARRILRETRIERRAAERVQAVVALCGQRGAVMTQVEKARTMLHPDPRKRMPDDEQLLRAWSVLGRINGALTDASDPIWPGIAVMFDLFSTGADTIGKRIAFAEGQIERCLSYPMQYRQGAHCGAELRDTLSMMDVAFSTLPPETFAWELSGARPRSEFKGNIGRGMRGAAHVLAVLCSKCGAFGAPRIEGEPTAKQLNEVKARLRGLQS